MSRRPASFATHPMPFPDRPAYRAVCRYVVDGDTLDAEIDLGLYQYAYETVRLHGIDAPELYRPADDAERVRAQAARERVQQLVLDKPVRLTTYRDRETFGRFEADVEFFDGAVWQDLVTILKAEGHGA